MHMGRERLSSTGLEWILVALLLGWIPNATGHDIHFPTDCHGALIVQLKTNYLDTEFDAVRTIVTSQRTGETITRLATPVSASPTSGVRVFEYFEVHDRETFEGRVELLKCGAVVAHRPFRAQMPNDLNCTAFIVTVLIGKPAAHAIQSYALIDDQDFNGVPSPGDVLRIRAEITGDDKSTAKYVNVPEINVRLIPGTVEASSGEILVGNAQLDSRVVVTDIALDKQTPVAEVVFQVEILPLVVASQGQISLVVGSPKAPELLTATILTDDADSPEEDDATLIPVSSCKETLPPPN